jgi:hypothetical protein
MLNILIESFQYCLDHESYLLYLEISSYNLLGLSLFLLHILAAWSHQKYQIKNRRDLPRVLLCVPLPASYVLQWYTHQGTNTQDFQRNAHNIRDSCFQRRLSAKMRPVARKKVNVLWRNKLLKRPASREPATLWEKSLLLIAA